MQECGLSGLVCEVSHSNMNRFRKCVYKKKLSKCCQASICMMWQNRHADCEDIVTEGMIRCSLQRDEYHVLEPIHCLRKSKSCPTCRYNLLMKYIL